MRAAKAKFAGQKRTPFFTLLQKIGFRGKGIRKVGADALFLCNPFGLKCPFLGPIRRGQPIKDAASPAPQPKNLIAMYFPHDALHFSLVLRVRGPFLFFLSRCSLALQGSGGWPIGNRTYENALVFPQTSCGGSKSSCSSVSSSGEKQLFLCPLGLGPSRACSRQILTHLQMLAGE